MFQMCEKNFTDDTTYGKFKDTLRVMVNNEEDERKQGLCVVSELSSELWCVFEKCWQISLSSAFSGSVALKSSGFLISTGTLKPKVNFGAIWYSGLIKRLEIGINLGGFTKKKKNQRRNVMLQNLRV